MASPFEQLNDPDWLRDPLQWAEHITVTVTVAQVSARFSWDPEPGP